MKLRANRGRRDTDDIEYLLGRCDVNSVRDAQEIYERYHAHDVLTDSAVARVQTCRHPLSPKQSVATRDGAEGDG